MRAIFRSKFYSRYRKYSLMKKRLVVAMSTACLDYYKEPHNVRTLRLNIRMDESLFVDGETLNAAEFEDWLIQHPRTMARTSPPSPSALNRFFLKIADEGYTEVLVVAMSSALSQTYTHIKEAAALFAGKLKIHLFDTKTGAFTEGFIALEADRCFRAGLTTEKTIARLQHLRQTNTLMFAVSDLSYLINNGRLSQTTGFIANALNIKPIIQVTPKGEAVVAEKIISFSRAMHNMSNQLGQYMKSGGKKQYIYLLYTGTPREWFREFEGIIAKKHGLKNLPVYPISPVVSAHSGPNSVGFGIFWDL